jgi:hypothetical protein
VKTVELGDVVAERRLHVAGETERVVLVRIGRPQPIDARADYYCPYQIVGVGSERVKYACGVDSLQAMEEAIRILPAELNRLRRSCPGLRWEDGAAGDFGFRPVVEPAGATGS